MEHVFRQEILGAVLVGAMAGGCGESGLVVSGTDGVEEETAATEQAIGSMLLCDDATTLDALVECIADQMPRSGSEGFVPPTMGQQAAWRGTVAAMLLGGCEFPLPPAISQRMRLLQFHDEETDKSYCVLMETVDKNRDGYVDKGWGTFIVDPAATRELSHQAPHPLHDRGTDVEAVDVFKWTESRSFLLCGAHRYANSTPSACDPNYGEADCAHATDNMFFATTLEISAFYASLGLPYTQIEWHGMGASTCPGVDAYISHGLSTPPPSGAPVLALRARIEQNNPDWAVAVPGSGTCSQNATENVEGRFLNGVSQSSVCAQAATASTGRFVHIEQQPDYRDAADWFAAIADTWPSAQASPLLSLAMSAAPLTGAGPAGSLGATTEFSP